MTYTKKTWDETLRDLDATFERWGVEEWGAVPARPGRAIKYASLAERSVAVLFRLRGRDLRLECSEHATRPENLRALYNTIDAYRLMESRGTAGLMIELLKQLPAPTQQNADPYRALGVVPGAALDVAEAAYRALMRSAHPDRPGGSHEQATRLTAAIEAIRKEQTT